MTSKLSLGRRTVLTGAGALALPRITLAADAAPKPYGATPSPRQLAWQRMEANAFVHFTINTFTDKEWGYGDEQPSLFNPTDFDADQIVGVAKSGGFKGLIVTAKHHDGFCLWPSAFTEHSVKNSPFRGGKGDVVGEMAAACRRAGLKFGVYLSPWDRNRADYGSARYVEVYRAQLHELLTHYGPIFEVWFDGANGGDGYYDGARETRKIDAATYYDWPKTVKLVHTLQPGAVTFGPDQASDLRWVGNEAGVAGDPCWATMDRGQYTEAKGDRGVRDGPIWWPAEVDVSIRPGWFWHAAENAKVKPPAELETLYFQSVGRGANLLLNIPPDRRGQINEADAASVRAWGRALADMTSTNFADGAAASATSVWGPGFEAAKVLDGSRNTYWAGRDSASALTLRLAGPQTFDVIRLREYLALGLRVTRFALDVGDGQGGWRQVAEHLGIGAQRLVRLPAPVATDRVRLRILDAPAGPAISEISLFRAPRLGIA
jgi:alpha-L-fucosidase